MAGEKKKTSRKTLTSSDEVSAKTSTKTSTKTSAKPPSKASPQQSSQGKEALKSPSVVRRRARKVSSNPSSVLQDMVRGKEGPLLTTRTSSPSSRSRTAAGAQEKGKEKGKTKGRGRSSMRGYWQGQMLLASPAIGDQRFERSVIYLCHQGEDGALGLVVNKIAEKIQFTDVLDHLNIPFASSFGQISVHVGGPVESSRGFVLHSPEKMFAGTIELGDLAMTASADILKQIAEGKGPKDYVFLLGYAGWGTGQLDKEIERNAWLHLPFDRDLVFGEDDTDKWARAMQKLGVSPHLLSGASGNA